MGAIGDLLWTTLWDEGGAGPLTSRLMMGSWHTFLTVSRGNARVLQTTGPVILVSTLLMWILSIWVGWTFVFASAEPTIFDTIDGGGISWIDLAYFTGYTFFTLGNGGFAPVDGVWQILTVLTTASGMLLVTLTMTYVLSVLDAVTQKHAFAQGVTGIGLHPEALLTAYWSGEKFDGLDLHLDTFSSQMDTLTANHNAYPLLHYFYSKQAEKAPVTAIAVLDGTLTVLRFGTEEEHQPSRALLRDTRSSVESYVEALSSHHQPADRTPVSPDLTELRETDYPAIPEDTFEESLSASELDERRQKRLAIVENDAREWPSADERYEQE